MTANQVAIRKAVRRLLEPWSPWSPGKLESYGEALDDLWPEDVDLAVTEVLRKWTQLRPPPPGVVREHALARSGTRRTAGALKRGPVAWHEARTPLHQGEDGYMRDADDRYVLHPSEPRPPRDESGIAEPWVAFMWTARTLAKLKAKPRPELVPFVELARRDGSESDFRGLWHARKRWMDESGMSAEEVNQRLLRELIEALRPQEAA